MAVAASPDPTDVPPGTRTCRNGHLMWGYNLVRVRHVSGRLYDSCRACRRDSVNRVRARKRGERVPLLAPTPVAKQEPQFVRAELWSLLPSDLRRAVAGVMLDPEPPDPVAQAIIRRAARRRAWVGLGVHFAAVALVEALIEESREARSTRLRIDHLLRVILR